MIRHKCTLCGYLTFSKFDIEEHVQRVHKTTMRIKCLKCAFVSRTDQENLVHEKEAHQNGGPLCRICMVYFCNQPKYDQHMRTHNRHCKQCNALIQTDYQMAKHYYQEHHQELQFRELTVDGSCGLCNYVGTTYYDLKSHGEFHCAHDPDIAHLFACVLCAKTIEGGVFMMEEHLRNDHDDRYCGTCRIVTFPNKRMSTSSCMHQCLLCYQLFGTTTALHYHIQIAHYRSHSNDAPNKRVILAISSNTSDMQEDTSEIHNQQYNINIPNNDPQPQQPCPAFPESCKMPHRLSPTTR